MAIPNKIFAVTNYRYGFNGKEKDNEVKGNGNSLDYGDREYDPRLGKWFSADPMRKIYAALSPYHFGGNNPLNISDADGNILKDKNGNIIATADSRVDEQKNKITYNYGDGRSLTVSYKYVTIYTDQGNPVTAKMVTKAVYSEMGKNGKMVEKPAVPKGLDPYANCHGYAFAEGKVIITDGESMKTIIKDEYSYLGQDKVNNKNADIIVLLDVHNSTPEEQLKEGEIDPDDWHHTAKKEKANGKLKATYTDKDDEIARRYHLTPEDVELFDKEKGDQKILYYKKEKDKDGKRVNATTGTPANGVRIVTKEEIEKIKAKLKPAPGG